MPSILKPFVGQSSLAFHRPEALWTVARGRRRYLFDICTNEKNRWELQIRRNGEYVYRSRHTVRSAALEEAEDWRRRFEAKGWTVMLDAPAVGLAPAEAKAATTA